MCATDADALAALVFCKLLALEQHLECGPEGRRRGERAVHVDGAMREAGADGLVDVNHWEMRTKLEK